MKCKIIHKYLNKHLSKRVFIKINLNMRDPKKVRKYVIIAVVILVLCFWHYVFSQMLLSNQRYHVKQENTSYILLWTSHTTIPLTYLSYGADKFEKDGCAKKDCFVTWDHWYFPSVEMFDVLLFHGPELVTNEWLRYPAQRSSAQKYVFASIESSENYPICDSRFDGYFNWTWTYEMSSDIPFNYITIRDKSGNIVGPKQNMQWVDSEDIRNSNLDERVKEKLKSKSKAAAWFVSNCKPLSQRNIIAEQLGKELKKYGLELDVYGGCGKLKCPVDNSLICDRKVQEHYYFYLSFENSRARDYVTEKLLRPLRNFAVPVVYGAADYSRYSQLVPERTADTDERFLPDGSYLDASKFNATVLAKQMKELIENQTAYYEYFKWHNYYSYHDSSDHPDSNPYCALCAKIMEDKEKITNQVHYNFRDSWNDYLKCEPATLPWWSFGSWTSH